jgi:hypothetical protein
LLEVSGWSSAVSQFIAILAADATITGIDGQRHGIIDHWLQPIRDVAEANGRLAGRQPVADADPAIRLEALASAHHPWLDLRPEGWLAARFEMQLRQQ